MKQNIFSDKLDKPKQYSFLRALAISSVLVIAFNLFLLVPSLNDIKKRILSHQLEVAEKISLEFQQLLLNSSEEGIRNFSLELKEDENELVYVADDSGYVISHYLPFKIGHPLSDNIKLYRGSSQSKYIYKFFSYEDVLGQKLQAVAFLLEPTNFTIVVEEEYYEIWNSWYKFLATSLLALFSLLALIMFLARNTLKMFNFSRRLSEEKEQTSSIVSNLDTGIIEYDSDFRIILMNRKAEELLGISQSTALGKVINSDSIQEDSRLKPLVEVLYPALAQNIKKICIEDGKCKTMEMKLDNPRETELLIDTIPIHNQEKNVYRYLKVMRDISREKAIAKSKSEFISVAAHQLRTPLSAIKWVFKMLLDGDAGPVTNEQRTFLQKGYQSNEKIIELVGDMLDVARIEEGRFGFEFYYADILNIIEKAAESFQVKAMEKNIKLIIEKPDGRIKPIKVDPARIELILQNLVDNAVKYTPTGGSVTIKIEVIDGFLQIGVHDTGVGVPKEQQQKLFTKFFRGTNAMKVQTEGTGLGLFIARNIVSRHGGKIWVQTEEGKGSTFYFTLPIDDKLIPSSSVVTEEFMEGL